MIFCRNSGMPWIGVPMRKLSVLVPFWHFSLDFKRSFCCSDSGEVKSIAPSVLNDEMGAASTPSEPKDAASSSSSDMDAFLCPHGTPWKVVDHVEVDLCQKTHKASIRLPSSPNEERTPLELFNVLFPYASLSSILQATNKKLRQCNYNDPLTMLELYKWLGIRLSVIIDRSHGSIDHFWEETVDEWSVFPASDYGARYGMTKQRFKLLQDCFRLNSSEDDINNNVIIQVTPCGSVYCGIFKNRNFCVFRTPGSLFAHSSTTSMKIDWLQLCPAAI